MHDQLLTRLTAALTSLAERTASTRILLIGEADEGLSLWASEGSRTRLLADELAEGDTADAAVLYCEALDEPDYTHQLDLALRHIPVGRPLAVVVQNSRHFLELCRAASRGELATGDGRDGLTIGAAANLITESGFDIEQSTPLRAGYCSPAAHRTGFELDGVKETDPARLTTLAHAQLIVARRSERAPDRYDEDRLVDLWDSGEQDAAVAYITGHLTRNQDRARLWNDLAVILVEANLADDAIACVRRALSCDPFHTAARANLAELVESFGAEVGFEGSSILEVDADLALKHARDLLSLGDSAQALRWAELGFMTSPGEESAAELGLVLRTLGRPRCAGEIAEILAQLNLGARERHEGAQEFPA